MKLVGFPGGEERKQENSLASVNEVDMGSRRTVRYFSHPPHSADEMWSFAQSHTSGMKS